MKLLAGKLQAIEPFKSSSVSVAVSLRLLCQSLVCPRSTRAVLIAVVHSTNVTIDDHQRSLVVLQVLQLASILLAACSNLNLFLSSNQQHYSNEKVFVQTVGGGAVQWLTPSV